MVIFKIEYFTENTCSDLN